MARYRVPDTRKKLSGSFRADRATRRSHGDGLASAPPAPEHLTERARTEWDRLAPLIWEQQTLTASDLRGLELLCETLGTAQQAQETIATAGLTIAGDGGRIRAHPAIKILEAARSQATRLLIEYGLTPRARSHVEPAMPATPDNPFAKIA